MTGYGEPTACERTGASSPLAPTLVKRRVVSGSAPTLAAMADVTFDDAFDWLADHQGQRVWVEVGCKDPRTEDADFAVLRVDTTLGAIYMVGDRERGTGVLRVPIGDTEHGGFEVDPGSFQSAKIHLGLLKVWQHGIYIVVSPVRV